jgi:hypothetical protein
MPMPAYEWICHVCAAANPAQTEACAQCKSLATLSGNKISRLRQNRGGSTVAAGNIPLEKPDRPWWIPDAVFALLAIFFGGH